MNPQKISNIPVLFLRSLLCIGLLGLLGLLIACGDNTSAADSKQEVSSEQPGPAGPETPGATDPPAPAGVTAAHDVDKIAVSWEAVPGDSIEYRVDVINLTLRDLESATYQDLVIKYGDARQIPTKQLPNTDQTSLELSDNSGLLSGHTYGFIVRVSGSQNAAFATALHSDTKGTFYKKTEGGKTYAILEGIKLSWDRAKDHAETNAASLVIINDATEQTAVEGFINSAVADTLFTIPNASVSDGGGINYLWIGASDSETEGTWKWVDGTPLGVGNKTTWSLASGAYANWGKIGAIQNEPDNYLNNQDYAAIGLAGWPVSSSASGSQYQWNDIAGTNRIGFILEYR